MTLYDSRAVPQGYGSAGSCTELVESVPGDLDGGFFDPVAFGHHIETGGGNCDPCDDDSSTTTSESSTTTTEAHDGLDPLATGQDVEVSGGGYVGGHTLTIDAQVEDGDVTGEVTEFRVDNVVVTLQCADTEFDDKISSSAAR